MTRNLQDWSLLRTLLAVARAGSLQGAAEQLARSRPTVGREMRLLERTMGSKLLIRTAYGVDLTEMGHRVLHVAEEMEKLVGGVTHAAGGDSPMSGTVCFKGGDGYCAYVMTGILPALHAAHPEITLKLLSSDLQTEPNLSRREADFTILHRPPRDPDLCVIKYGRFKWSACMARHYAEFHGQPATIAQLRDHPLLLLEALLSDEVPWSQIARALGDHPRLILQTDSIFPLIRAVRAGLGISILPRRLAAVESDLLFIDVEDVELSLPYWIVSHVEVKAVPAVRVVLDFVKEYLD